MIQQRAAARFITDPLRSFIFEDTPATRSFPARSGLRRSYGHRSHFAFSDCCHRDVEIDLWIQKVGALVSRCFILKRDQAACTGSHLLPWFPLKQAKKQPCSIFLHSRPQRVFTVDIINATSMATLSVPFTHIWNHLNCLIIFIKNVAVAWAPYQANFGV